MTINYTSERNIQIVVSLLKAHGIKRVVASPGATDYIINATLQQDPWFEMYSSIDERSAAYMACGIAAESGEPVAITCTGATSARNYEPGLTEAYYRHLPVLAITGCRSNANVGHYVDQVTDRGQLPRDIVNESVYLQKVETPEDEWDCMIKANKAILALTRNGGGPSHINLVQNAMHDFTTKELPYTRIIKRYTLTDDLPVIKATRVGIFVGAFNHWNDELTSAVDSFCEVYNGAVFCDPTSNYKGKYRVLFPLIVDQCGASFHFQEMDLMIHIGYVSNTRLSGKEIWRVNLDGEVRDTFRKLTKVFQMSELDFFRKYSEGKDTLVNTYHAESVAKYRSLYEALPELPFSNLWVARQLSGKLPEHSVLHLGIRNSIRSWSYFEIPSSVRSYCNTGGFGIDGGMSSLIGASFLHREKLYFGVFGDLLFYYDMNSLGNRDIKGNLRIIVINNGIGQEFKNYSCASSQLGDAVDSFIGARGHFKGNATPLIKAYVENLGFEYLTASNKEDFLNVYERFINPDITDKPILFEIKVSSEDESMAHQLATTITTKSKFMKTAKAVIDRPELVEVKKVIKKLKNK